MNLLLNIASKFCRGIRAKSDLSRMSPRRIGHPKNGQGAFDLRITATIKLLAVYTGLPQLATSHAHGHFCSLMVGGDTALLLAQPLAFAQHPRKLRSPFLERKFKFAAMQRVKMVLKGRRGVLRCRKPSAFPHVRALSRRLRHRAATAAFRGTTLAGGGSTSARKCCAHFSRASFFSFRKL